MQVTPCFCFRSKAHGRSSQSLQRLIKVSFLNLLSVGLLFRWYLSTLASSKRPSGYFLSFACAQHQICQLLWFCFVHAASYIVGLEYRKPLSNKFSNGLYVEFIATRNSSISVEALRFPVVGPRVKNLSCSSYGYGSTRKPLGTLLPIGFFWYPFLTHSHIVELLSLKLVYRPFPRAFDWKFLRPPLCQTPPWRTNSPTVCAWWSSCGSSEPCASSRPSRCFVSCACWCPGRAAGPVGKSKPRAGLAEWL